MAVLPVREFEIYEPITSYSKEYPSFTRLITYENPVKVRASGFVSHDEIVPTGRKKTTPNPLALLDSIRRTKKEIADITLCNDFDMFATFTFSKDRQDVDKCKIRMSKWLKNQRERVGKFKYLIIPEFHKDGKSLHFHALLSKYQGKLHKSGIRQNGKDVYNIKSYRLGFTNVSYIQDKTKVASYIRKYITKDMPKFTGKKRYWCSTGLVRPVITKNPLIDPWTLESFKEVYKRNQLTILHLNATLPMPTNYKEQYHGNRENNKYRRRSERSEPSREN